MYYCKVCGNTVKSTDMFCDKCGTVLNEQTMADMYEMSKIKSPVEDGQFSPDSCITKHNISGAIMFDYRLTNKECSLLGWDYYKATKLENNQMVTMTVAHMIITKDMFYDLCYLNMSLNEETTTKLLKDYVLNIVQSQTDFSNRCNSMGITPLVKDTKYLKSELYETYHIFMLLEDALPLVEYYSKNKLSTKDIAQIGLNIVNTSMVLGVPVNKDNTLNDTNIFINDKREVFFLKSLNDIYTKYFIITPHTVYNKIFESPYNKNRLMYSIGVILYRMLNHGKNMFQDENFENKSYYKMELLKQKKILPQRQISMQCLLGKIIEYSLSNFDSEEKSMYVLKTLLERNYS
ncbi:MAG: zinc ribbon domain-containing protein [Ruminococcus sp.]|nr:zinc ribbon domain-containing protein [Ruminococcus sp.]MCD7801061.1 zinc ribbon domain-containing protein [Ruminococcus sp.]